jgi:hypothetical protein
MSTVVSNVRAFSIRVVSAFSMLSFTSDSRAVAIVAGFLVCYAQQADQVQAVQERVTMVYIGTLHNSR